MSRSLPVLPIPDTVLFPQGVISLTIGPGGTPLVDDAMKADRLLVLVAQLDLDKEQPSFADLYQIGTLALIARMVRVGEDTTQLAVRGRARVRLLTVETVTPYLKCRILSRRPGCRSSAS